LYPLKKQARVRPRLPEYSKIDPYPIKKRRPHHEVFFVVYFCPSNDTLTQKLADYD